MPPRARLRWAVALALVLHGALVLTARYRLSYDAYTHMLLGDHYRQDWWSLWEPRWYAGFAVTSYPPLVHQAIGLLGHFTGVDAAYALLLWAVTAAYPLAVYAFCRVFTGPAAAGWAALGGALSPAVYLSAHTFGQLPTLAGGLFALAGAAPLAGFLRSGNRLEGALAVLSVSVVIGAHHATLLFLPWVWGVMSLRLFLDRQVQGSVLLARLAVFGILAAFGGLAVIWPFWQWGLGQTMQTPIDHLSRHNFFTDPSAAGVFFWPVYGPLVAVIPFALWQARARPYASLSIAAALLFLLGLGGTTPLPRWLFGPSWEWLTYDRFGLWAALLLLPFLGMLCAQAHNWLRRALLLLLAGAALLAGLYPTLWPTQPRPIEMQPIVAFLAQADRSQWRYLTFGFGDQFAYLNRLTRTATIDGSYHTARQLPELRASGIGQIDSALWLPGGLAKLGPLLQNAGKYGVRWGFVNHPAYLPTLKEAGWFPIATLTNGVAVWENPAAVLVEPPARPIEDPLASFSWGAFPWLALGLMAALFGLWLWPARTQSLLYGIHALTVGLLPVALGFWYFRRLTDIEHSRVYFTYDNALFFLADALAALAVMAWSAARWFGPPNPVKPLAPSPSSRWAWTADLRAWLLAFCILASASLLWSIDRRVSLYVSLHLWLGLGLFLSLRARPAAWRCVALGACAVLAIQAAVGIAQYALQSTHFLEPLRLNWPGSLEPSIRGASVVQLPTGARWLRVYGTLPHPNILGAMIVALLAGPAALVMTGRSRWAWAALAVFAGAMAVLVLTFSRGAWVGLAAAAIILFLKFRCLNPRRLAVLACVGALSLAAAAWPTRELIFTRMGDPSATPTEDFSIKGRAWLGGQAVSAFERHPIVGVGIGGFILDLAQRAGPGYIIEPAHSLPLLAAAELGLAGLLALAGLTAAVTRGVYQARRPAAVVWSAALVGLAAASLFDHSLWSLAPGRLFLFLILGVWAGQQE